jgi:hypothetical protein
MKEPQDIHLENLREALKQYDAYLRLAIAASLTYTLISFVDRSSSPVATNLSFLPVPLPMSYPTLALLAVGAQFILVLLAASTLDAVVRALLYLTPDQQVLKAACGYPSLATAQLRWMRIVAVLASPMLLALAMFVGNWESIRDAPIPALLSFLFFAAPYLVLARIMWTHLAAQTQEYAGPPSDPTQSSTDTGAV